MIGIIAAMDIEMSDIKSKMTDAKQETVSGHRIHGRKTVRDGRGSRTLRHRKGFAAVCAEIMILRYSPDIIISGGVAGALSDELSCTDLAIAESLVQHRHGHIRAGRPCRAGIRHKQNIFPCERQYMPLLCTAAERCGVKYQKGVIASGDKFIGNTSDKDRIRSAFDAIACEMESAAIAQVCYINGTEMLALRAISDSANSSAKESYENVLEAAAEVSASVILEFVRGYSELHAEKQGAKRQSYFKGTALSLQIST